MLCYKHYMKWCSAFHVSVYHIQQRTLLTSETRRFNSSSPKPLSSLIPRFHFSTPNSLLLCSPLLVLFRLCHWRRQFDVTAYGVAEMLIRAKLTQVSFQSGEQAIYILPMTEPYYINTRTNCWREGVTVWERVWVSIRTAVMNPSFNVPWRVDVIHG